MISLAGKTPNEPPAQATSPELSEGGRVYSEKRKNGTPCQEWISIFAGGCVVAGHGQSGGAKVQKFGDQGVHLFYNR